MRGSRRRGHNRTTTVLDRGPHSQVDQAISADVDEQGNTVSVTNTFTQLQTGVNRWSEPDGGWVPAAIEIESLNGTFLSRQTQHEVTFAASADATEGTINLVMVNGAQFRVRPMGIAHTEFKNGQPGKSVFIAELQPSAASLASSNEVTYLAALDYADLAYDLSLAGLEQNVVFRRQLPRPESFQMDPSLVRVECWNQILETPTPSEQSSGIVRPDGSVDTDAQLDFGPMQINAGRAFGIGAAADSGSIRVAKLWQTISNSVYLIESVPYAELAPLLARLPAQQASRSVDSERLRQLWTKQSSGKRSVPLLPPEARSAKAPARQDTRVASIRRAPDRSAPGVNLDWSLLGSATNFTFKGDTTYYVSGPVTLSSTTNGMTTIEGGAVVKFTNSANAQITISGPIACQTSAYRPAVFTSKDSDDVGEKITGSTGSPSGYYGYGIYLYNSGTLHDVRFVYANTAITLIGQQTLTLQDSQFVQCYDALYCYNLDTFNLENDLFHNLNFLFSTGLQSNTVYGVNLTVHNCGTVSGSSDASNVGSLTNCLLVSVTNMIPGSWTVDSEVNARLSSEAGIFLTVGAGSHYLQASNCPAQLHNTGTTNISPALLARLSQKTTYPPAILTNNFTGNTTLAPIVPRDDDGLPDLGFHYDPIDFAWSDLMVTNCTLTLTNGVVVAIYGVKGTLLHNRGKFISEGDPIYLNRLTRYQTVQEQPVVWGGVNNQMELFYLSANASPSPQVRLTYTDVSVMADAYNRRTLLLQNSSAVNDFTAYRSQLRGLFFGYSDSTLGSGAISWTNNLVERSTFSWTQNDTASPFTLSLYNNLFRNGTNSFNTANNSVGWTVKDNLFENANVSKGGTASVGNSNNGYYPANASKLPASGGGDVTLTNVDYQASFLGSFYYPTSGTNLARLINSGSRTASSAGLTNFTTTTNQVSDSGTVDIGFHSFAVSTNTTVTILTTQHAVEPDGGVGGQQGKFTVSRTGSTTSDLDVFYKVGGTALPGTDYQALSNWVRIFAGAASQDIPVTPIDNNTETFDKTVIASLILTNTYFVGSPSQATVTVQDSDALSTNPVSVASISPIPTGIDFYPVYNSLIISRNDTSGNEKNFKRLDSNGVLSDWSSASGLGFTEPDGSTPGEIKMAIVQISTNNWTQGELYFGPGQSGKIGRISADGSSVNTNWATLTNSAQAVGETNVFLGGFHIDQTGVFGGDLIVVTGSGGVWRVTASTNATKLAQINDANGNGTTLEGVLTVPNDGSKYGPWAGKILTCAESAGMVCAVDTNGVVTVYNPGLGAPEDVRLIASSQNLYCVDFTHNQVLKVTADNFAGFAGDLLFVDEGLGCAVAGVYVVHWTGGGFAVRQIPIATSLEHVVFAPIDIPALP